MTISIIKKTVKFFTPKEGEPKKEPEVKEKVLSEFRTTPENATAILAMLTGEFNYQIFNKDDDMEFSHLLPMDKSAIEEEIIIKFAK